MGGLLVFVMSMLVIVSNGLFTFRTNNNHMSSSSNYISKDVFWFNQTLDHFSPYDHRKFQQRYYEYLDDFRIPNGPIFLVLAKKFGAAIVTLEHRYYGKSSPFKSFTTKNIKFFSSKQALFDLAAFRQFYQKNVENPWFVFGISYVGALSAWFRLKFPHLTCGSLASSGVVHATIDFTQYHQQIGESTGPECKAILQEVAQLVEEQLDSYGETIKTKFGASELIVDGDFMYYLADAAAAAIQYGNHDKLCTPMTEAKKAGQDLVDAYAKFVTEYYFGSFGVNIKTYTNTPDCGGSRYHFDLCKNVFGEGVYPVVNSTNLYYGGKDIAGSKIVFTNGSQDPWRHASKQVSSPDLPSYIATCNKCGHGTDLRGYPQSPLVPEGKSKNCSNPEVVNKVR